MKYDALVIGAGQGGIPLAIALAGKGMKVALAEGRWLGGSCVNYGCSPSKTMIASARVAHMARRAADYGVQTGEVTVDFARVMQRAQDIVTSFRGNNERRVAEAENLTLYRDYVCFEDAHTVQVGDHLLEAERIYINTGQCDTPVRVPGLLKVNFLDSISLLQLKTLPEHLLILGGGYVGGEYAQAFRRFGSEVTIVSDDAQLFPKEDADIAQAALEIFEAEGIRVLLNAEAQLIEQQADGRLHMTVQHDGQTETLNGTHLLVATGRQPNTERLELADADIKTDDHGYIVVDDHLQTSVEGVWALGDVNGRGAFTHTSYNDYEIILDNLNGGKRKVSDRIMTYALFIDPPLGRVGMTEQQVREDGREALIATLPMSRVSRAQESDETQGLMKVLVDAETEQFLGAAVLGIGGDEVIHTITDLMYAKAPYTVMQKAVHIHPTVTEMLPTLLGELKPLE